MARWTRSAPGYVRVAALSGAAVLAALSALALARHGTAAPHPRRGAVVLYLVDTLRFDRMSAYGARRDTTPAARRLAAEGVRYDAAYSVCTWTRPAVAALFTSRLPAESGTIERSGVLGPGLPVMAELFRRAGYRTASFCGNPNVSVPPYGFGRGFGSFVDSGLPVPKLASGDRLVGPAARWIAAQPDSAFFLFVHVVDPHAPYDHTLRGYAERFSGDLPSDPRPEERTLAEYDGLIRQADDQFARLRSALERRGFWENALVIYLADHGEQFLEHGGQFHGDTLFEETLRIPMIVRGPGWGRPGEVVRTPVSLLDVLPSLAHREGWPPDSAWRGEAIDDRPPDAGRELYFSEELDGARLYGLRRGPRKVIVSLNPPFRIGFDLSRDPGEQTPADADAELFQRAERLRAAEIRGYGGLWLHREGIGPFRLYGSLTGVDPADPYLLWSDRERFPNDLARPDVLRLDRRVSEGEPFDLHVTRLENGIPMPEAEISVEAGGAAWKITANVPAPGPLRITRRPMSPLSEAEQAEGVKRMRALGYLGGN
jgi:arylsulfatase A-like enzyme